MDQAYVSEAIKVKKSKPSLEERRQNALTNGKKITTLIPLDLEKYKNFLRLARTIQIKKFKVLKRDNFKCVKCGAEENLTIDHVKKIISKETGFPTRTISTNNCQTLCVKCHIEKNQNGELAF